MRSSRKFLLSGLFLIILGLVVNRWTIGYFFRPIPRPISGTFNVAIILLLQGILLSLGCFLILKRKTLTYERIRRYYRTFSVFSFTVLAVFVILNLAMYALATIKASIGGRTNPIAKKYGDFPLRELYPKLSKEEVGRLLSETWSRPLIYEPFTQFKERPISGQYVNVDENGFRYIKNQDPWPPKQDNLNVFMFGGSTTFNYGVPDDETIASNLQSLLRQSFPRKNIAIYNFGRGHYYSSQERILFEKLLTAGYVPQVAVFIDGINDFDYAFINDEPMFTDRISAFFNGDSSVGLVKSLPIINLISSSLGNWGKPNIASTSSQQEEEFARIKVVLNRYFNNKKIIESTAKTFNVKPLFIWQPIPTYKYDIKQLPFEIGAVGIGTLGYPVMAESLSKNSPGNNFLYLADIQENIKKPLYVDAVHYSGEMSKIIAEQIQNFVIQKKIITP